MLSAVFVQAVDDDSKRRNTYAEVSEIIDHTDLPHWLTFFAGVETGFAAFEVIVGE